MRFQHPMMVVLATVALAGASCLISVGQLAAARTDGAADTATSSSILGNYLAGRFAKSSHDTENAVKFYRRALSAAPDNSTLIDHAFQVEAVEGNYVNAYNLAQKVVKTEPTHRLANIWLGVSEFQRGNFSKSRQYFKDSARGPIGELTSVLSLAWEDLATGDSAAALRRDTTCPGRNARASRARTARATV